MNEITSYQSTQLPDTLEDLTQFVLVGKAKLDLYMLRLKNINKVSMAQSIRDQTLKEAQEVSTALIAAEQRIGELLLSIPTASGKRTDLETSGQRSTKVKTKTETISEIGYGEREAKDYQQMAKNPEIVQRVIDEAISNGDVVTKSQVMKQIAEAKRQAKEESQAENDKLRKALSESESKRILAEQNAKPKEIIKEVEVIPDDYEKTKSDFESYKSQYQKMVNERKKAVDEMLEAKRKLREIENGMVNAKSQLKLEEESEFFALRTYDFIKQNGGYIWIFDKINELPEDKLNNFRKAIYALDAYAKQMVENIGGYGIE